MKKAARHPFRSVTFVGAILWASACGDPAEPNRAPAAVGSVPAQSAFVGDTVEIVVSGYFGDPDGDALTYAANSSDVTVASVTVSADTVRVIGLTQGSTTVTVTASDPEGLSATQSFTVTVPNRAPEVVASIPAASVDAGVHATVIVSGYFSDPDGDLLSYEAESSDAGVVSVSVSGEEMRVTGVAEGSADVVVTASDPGGLSVGQTFPVEVGPDRQRAILAALYEATEGAYWTNSDNWMTSAPLDEWFGVETDEYGQVTAIRLGINDLSGHLPPELGELPRLEQLRLRWNYLRGSIPPELGKLASMLHLDLDNNQLTGTIPSELGDIPGLQDLRLAGNGLSGPIPPELGKLSSLGVLLLDRNELTGTIPSELGDLGSLTSLYLHDNRLTGSIPAELGNLSLFGGLFLNGNRLTGSIPRELGNLSDVDWFRLNGNRLTGSIPAELGRLSRATEFNVSNNDLSGSLPSELGDLSSVKHLYLSGNDFSGALPAEFANLERLQNLAVTDNPKLTGPISRSFTNLENVESFLAGGTGLCAPDDPTFLDWLKRVLKRRVHLCGRETSAPAYLVQSVQQREFPVPLVPGREALLRAFVTATRDTDEKIPPVVARFYRNGSETYTVTIPGKSVAMPTEVDESSLDKSSNASIPGTVVRPGLEMVIEIDPEDTVNEDLLVRKRIPEEGRLKFEVDSLPAFDLTLVPFLWEEAPDSAVLEWIRGMADEDEEHQMLRDAYDLLPVEGVNASAHDPVVSSSNTSNDLVRQVRAIRTMEGGTGYWMGSMTGLVYGAAGVAYVGGKASFVTVSASIIAHELGHNLNNRHAPGCSAPNADHTFPQPDGSIGAWGYDHRAKKLVSPSTSDLMTYCRTRWISDYFFTNMVRYRLIEAENAGSPNSFASGPGILLWGGIDAEGAPSLEPAFVVDAQPSGPRGPGPYTLIGTSAADDRLFSFSFDMEEVADAEGETAHFVFVLPVDPGWAGSLAGITLVAPNGTVTLDGDTDAPMAIVRDIRSGQVRAFLRGLSEPPALSGDLKIYWSRGIPELQEWER